MKRTSETSSLPSSRDYEIRELSSRNLVAATAFANTVLDDNDFTHFTHHMPNAMLTNEWEVHLLMDGKDVAAWGQIQKFPDNPRKRHVVRVGFVVHPYYRGIGLGGVILNHVITERCGQYEKITATVFQDNLIMLGMFLRRGFVVEGCFLNEEYSNGTYRHVLSLAKSQGRTTYEREDRGEITGHAY